MLKKAIFTFTDAPVAVFEQEGPIWLEALPARTYQTPQYGEVPVTVDKLERFVGNFKSGVRGQEIAVDFEHGMDRAKGSKAAGWYRDFDVRPSSADPTQFSLWAAVDFTDEARNEIKDKQWKYFSLEWDDAYKNEKGEIVPDVVIGGGVTNRPIAKRTMPINFSEEMLNEYTKEELAIEVIGEQKEWEHSEPGTGPTPQIGSPEQDDPGTGQPVPRKQGDPNTEDPAIGGGWRRITQPLDPSDPAAPKPGGEMKGDFELTPEDIAKLKKALGLDETVDDSELVTAAETMFSELNEFKGAINQGAQEKAFAEAYPEVWKEHERLLNESRKNSARTFSESVSRITKTEGEKQVATTRGLSTLAQEKVEEVHAKFSEGTATTEDFEEAINTIVHGGLVEFGETGSNQEPIVDAIDIGSAQGIANTRRLFADKVREVQSEKDGEGKLVFAEHRHALNEAARRHPELAEAYRAAAPA